MTCSQQPCDLFPLPASRVARSGTRVTLLPCAGCVVTVNGCEVRGPAALQHGDRLVLAAEVFLRLHLPAHPLLGLRDFAHAKAELDRRNEEKYVTRQEGRVIYAGM